MGLSIKIYTETKPQTQNLGFFSYSVDGERGPAAHGKVAANVGGCLDGRLVAETPVVKKARSNTGRHRIRDEVVLAAAWRILCTTYRVWAPGT